VRLTDHPSPGGRDAVDDVEHLAPTGIGGDDPVRDRHPGRDREVPDALDRQRPHVGVGREHTLGASLQHAHTRVRHDRHQLHDLRPVGQP